MSKGDEVDQFALRKTRTSSSQETEDLNQPDRNGEGFHLIVDLFVSRTKCLRESCMRENRTYSLSGGRWPARKRATSDPTGVACGEETKRRKPTDKAILGRVSESPGGNASEPRTGLDPK